MELERVESEVPFGKAVHSWLVLHASPLDKLVHHDQIEQAYLAWETVRRRTNPYFLQGTGFEGYFVGICPSPEAALEAILATSQNILDAIVRLYRYEYGLKSRLMKTLTRENADPKAIHIWSSYLGAALGKLRSQVSTSREAEAFRARTYRLVSALPPISYYENKSDVAQTYAVGSDEGRENGKLYITLEMLNPGQRDAWLVAKYIGEFGHPLVRKILDHA